MIALFGIEVLLDQFDGDRHESAEAAFLDAELRRLRKPNQDLGGIWTNMNVKSKRTPITGSPSPRSDLAWLDGK